MLCLMVGFGFWSGSGGERSGGGDFFVVSHPFWFWGKKIDAHFWTSELIHWKGGISALPSIFLYMLYLQGRPRWYNLCRLLMLSLLSHGEGYHRCMWLPSRWHRCSLRGCRSWPHSHGWLPPFRRWIRSFCCQIRHRQRYSQSRYGWSWSDDPCLVILQSLSTY